MMRPSRKASKDSTTTRTLPVWLALPALFLGSALQAADRPPNIILILADDLGYGHPGCYGQEKFTTPNLDRLAAEGMKFTQAYAGAHVCAPSRSVLMTGLHAGHTPIRENGLKSFLDERDITVARLLQRAGYATGGFGKWGLGDSGTPGVAINQGFDEWFGQYNQEHAHFYYPTWVWHNETRYELPGNRDGKRRQYIADETQAKALDFIRRNSDRPFFAYLSYIIPHIELIAPSELEAPFRGKFPQQTIADGREGYNTTDDAYATLAAMITRLDHHVGEVMALLAKLDIDERTLVIFTSDNGAQAGARMNDFIDGAAKISDGGWIGMTRFFRSNGPLRGGKGSFYEGGIRVPFIVRWPGVVPAGAVSDHILGFQDFLATVCEVAALLVPAYTNGISFLPTLTGKGIQRDHKYLYWEYPRNGVIYQAMRLGDWKALQPRANAPFELYNLSEDLGETRNVADQHPEVMAKIQSLLAGARHESRTFPPDEKGSKAALYQR